MKSRGVTPDEKSKSQNTEIKTNDIDIQSAGELPDELPDKEPPLTKGLSPDPKE